MPTSLNIDDFLRQKIQRLQKEYLKSENSYVTMIDTIRKSVELSLRVLDVPYTELGDY